MHSQQPIHSLGKLRVKVTPSFWGHFFFILKPSTSECNSAIKQVIGRVINHKWQYPQNKNTLAIQSSVALRRMQECFKKNTNFTQLQWLIKDISTQQGGVSSDSQKGHNTFI